jgi:hypothetical protein
MSHSIPWAKETIQGPVRVIEASTSLVLLRTIEHGFTDNLEEADQ